MRILFILHQFYPEFSGGTERVALNLARAAQRAGHHAQVLACTIDPSVSGGQPCAKLKGALQTVYQGVPVTLVPRRLLPAAADFSFEPDSFLTQRLAAWMEHGRFDIAHVLHSMRMGSAILAAQRCGMPYILTLTDFFAPCFRINLVNISNQLCIGPNSGTQCAQDCLVAPWDSDSFVRRHSQAQNLLAAAAGRVCPSEYVANQYRNFFPELEFKIIPHGIDLLALATCARSPGHNNYNKSELTLGFVGSVVPQKGLDTLLRALACIPNKRLKLRVVGGFYGDPSYHRSVQRLITADPRIELLGPLSPLQAFDVIRSLDLLCLPSRVPETFSLVLHEAAAAGVPALVSNLGAPCERIIQHGGGLVLPFDDDVAWANAVAELVEHPEPIKIWQKELSLPLRIEEEAFFYESLYRKLITSH